jgi:hypothetical protein
LIVSTLISTPAVLSDHLNLDQRYLTRKCYRRGSRAFVVVEVSLNVEMFVGQGLSEKEQT